MKEDNRVEFNIEGSDEKVVFYIMEEVKINNATYLLVTEDEDETNQEVEAYILKEKEVDDNEEVTYEILENEEELTFVSKIFEAKIDEYDLEI
ncbi:uncharacterized protein DUF1292 [Natranaerovirga hydrolytica]|uniref:Uncharacterized protein DUF1292 n=1 Tax=Natranaerovirga hydrolytica TaxID=680378 RepID=A0A4R1N5V5_9FIRM|nr:DUF1292 domain-containing protein [Natranaerovirga hydrolytica]TCK98389.1 uncharacterized protein DUF1292 [Natranaerovirga hydrolytica]